MRSPRYLGFLKINWIRIDSYDFYDISNSYRFLGFLKILRIPIDSSKIFRNHWTYRIPTDSYDSYRFQGFLKIHRIPMIFVIPTDS